MTNSTYNSIVQQIRLLCCSNGSDTLSTTAKAKTLLPGIWRLLQSLKSMLFRCHLSADWKPSLLQTFSPLLCSLAFRRYLHPVVGLFVFLTVSNGALFEFDAWMITSALRTRSSISTAHDPKRKSSVKVSSAAFSCRLLSSVTARARVCAEEHSVTRCKAKAKGKKWWGWLRWG